MAIGEVVSALESVADGEYLTIQPAEGTEIVVHNLAYGGAVEIYFTDGANQVKADSDTGAGSLLGFYFHCTNSLYYRVKNVSGGAIYICYEGVVTREP